MLQTQCGGLEGKRHIVPTQKMLVAGENEQFYPATGCLYDWAGWGQTTSPSTLGQGAVPGADLQHSA